MKQHITVEQWSDLDKNHREKLLAWYTKSSGVSDGIGLWVPLSIGQMIEFLFVSTPDKVVVSQIFKEEIPILNICDYLWNQVKNVLEKV